MTSIFKFKYTVLTLSAALVLTSCVARQPYDREVLGVNENVFRTDRIPRDSASIATVSWREIFTDPVLQNHIQKGLDNNLDIRIALQNISIAESYLKQRKAAYQPTLAVGPSYTFQTQSLNTQLGRIVGGSRRYINVLGLEGDISWEADIWGKLKAEQKAQWAAYLGTVAAHREVKTDLVAAIASAYYQLLTFDEQKRVINATIALRNKNLETTRALKESGILTEVAVQQSEALVYNAQALLLDIDVQISMLENTISLLKGEAPQSIARSTISQQEMPASFPLGYSANLLSNRGDVMEAEARLIQAYELTDAARAQFYPSLRISGSTGLQSIELDKFFSVNSIFATVVGSLVQPILNKRQIRTNYEVSLYNRQIAYLNFRKTLLNAGKEVSDALKMYETQDQFIALKKMEVAAYRNSVDYSQELVNYGLANYLEVLNSSVNALNAELNISNAKFAKMKAGVELYRALGGGWR